MKIDLTEQEFRALLKLVYVGTQVSDAAQATDDASEELWDKLLEQAKGTACAEWVDDLDGVLVPSDEFEMDMHEQVLDSYADAVFWNELALQLATRDLARNNPDLVEGDDFNPETVEAMIPLMERYSDELAQNGLENLEIVERRKGR